MRRVGLEKVIVDVSGGGGRVDVSGSGRGFCGGDDFFLRGTRRGKLSSRWRLNGAADTLCKGGDACEVAEGIVAERKLAL